MKSILIIGHKNPDTDAVVSALGLAELFKKAPRLMPWVSGFRIQPARAGSLNRETKFLFKYFKQKPPSLVKSIKGRNVFLVDHNSLDQAVEGAREANILGVIDHHNLEGLRTSLPIFYCSEPIGSSSTIVARLFLKNRVSLSKKKAGLLLAAMVSDTLRFTSPTTTDEDKKIAAALAKISGENIKKLSQKMFEAKSDITGLSIKEIISRDYKEYKDEKMSFGFGVWETVDPSQVEKRREEIFSKLEEFKKERKTDLMFFALVDILKRNSYIFLLKGKETLVAEKSFGKKSDNGLLFLPGVVSRKKQMVVPIKNLLSRPDYEDNHK